MSADQPEWGADVWGAEQWSTFYRQVAVVLSEEVELEDSYCTELPRWMMEDTRSYGELDVLTRAFDGKLWRFDSLVYLAPHHSRDDLLPMARSANRRLLRMQPGDGSHLSREQRDAYLSQIAKLRIGRYLSDLD